MTCKKMAKMQYFTLRLNSFVTFANFEIDSDRCLVVRKLAKKTML